VRPEPGIERVEHDAGLDPDRARQGIEAVDFPEEFAVVDYESAADRLAALRRPGSARQNRGLRLAGERECSLGRLGSARNDHTQRLDLIDRSVR